MDMEEGPMKMRRPWATTTRILSLEGVARAALGSEMRLERPRANVVEANWGGPELGKIEW